MKRFWKWIVGQKNTIQKWQSTVLHLDRNQKRDKRHLKPIGGSDDEMERNEKRNSKILQEDNDNYNMSISLQDLNVSYENEPIDFEEFFEESFHAIESALPKMPTASSSSTPKKMSTSKELSLSLSLDSQSGSFRRDNRPKRPAIEIVPINDDSLDYDDMYVEYDEITSSSYSGNPKQTLPTPQMSTSCLSEPCNFLVAISDESTNIPSSSSFSSYQQETKSDNVAEADINQQTTKHQTFLTPSASTSFRETEKEKSGKRKKKLSLSLQQSHHSDVQVERQLTKSSSNETLIPLTSAQIYLIRNNWRQVYVTKGPTLIGSTILHGMCFKSRKIKDRFFKCPFPHRFPNRDSFNKAHAKAIGEMFDKIVDNSENLGSISSYLFAIGAMHTCLARRQLSREMWNLMAETFIDCTLDWGDKKGRTEASRIAWAFIIAHVIKKIKEGDLNERRRLAHYRQSSLLAPPRLSSTNVSLPSSSTSKLWKSVEECDRNI